MLPIEKLISEMRQAQHSAGLRWAFNEGGMDMIEVLTLASGVRWE